jgi:tetratricopeptide (TPR) repeat protein
VLAAALLVRAIAAFAPGMAWFGVNELRFLPPVAWALLVLAALLCVPAVARRALPVLRTPGQWIAERPATASLALGALLAGLVLLLPDRTAFVGDFLLREGSVVEAVGTHTLFPQALPLDTVLHYRLAEWAANFHLLDVNATARALGAVEAFVLGALAVAFARAVRARGAAACLVAGAVAFTGALGLMSGYGKAFSEMCLLTLATATFAVRVARDGQRIGALGLTIALGFALHRSVLALVPATVLALVIAARDPALRPRFVRPGAIAGLAASAVAMAAFLPRIIHMATGFDVTQHFASEEVTRHGGLLAAAFAPARLRDLANVGLAFTPLVALAFVATVDARSLRSREGAVLAALWAPLAALALVLFPAQGAFRDWDVFAATGIARAALAAWLLARLVDGAKSRAWLAPATIAVCATTTLFGLWLAHDRERGLARVQAFLVEPPGLSEVERSKTWDFLGATWSQMGRDSSAARAFELATQSSRNPRLYLQWAMAASHAGNLRESQRAMQELVAFAPGVGMAWTLLGSASWQLQDYPEAARAARALANLKPGDAEAKSRADGIAAFARAWQDSVRAAEAAGSAPGPRATPSR